MKNIVHAYQNFSQIISQQMFRLREPVVKTDFNKYNHIYYNNNTNIKNIKMWSSKLSKSEGFFMKMTITFFYDFR
jgi:hypothetical protein